MKDKKKTKECKVCEKDYSGAAFTWILAPDHPGAAKSGVWEGYIKGCHDCFLESIEENV